MAVNEANPSELEALRQRDTELEAEITELKAKKAEFEAKKTRCIQIVKEILHEEPIIEYRPLFLNGLELDAFIPKYRIALEVQRAQHRFHSTSWWYKDVKKLENIVNRDRQKRCIYLDNGSFLLEIVFFLLLYVLDLTL
ncbi:hypothetical protein RclHR1_01520004 [Rhizophagus clarus]|uniref:Uncharacterized protein n=1 Tax=Rhizophagus clarus TaxID=94130 RepID=A0A2Z6QRZ4_9GLOM|nr:hypothetical protein RclHR1_01520004 [Rhizophagus clarus]